MQTTAATVDRGSSRLSSRVPALLPQHRRKIYFIYGFTVPYMRVFNKDYSYIKARMLKYYRGPTARGGGVSPPVAISGAGVKS